MKNVIGQELSVGDRVVYSPRTKYSRGLIVGTLVAITEGHASIKSETDTWTQYFDAAKGEFIGFPRREHVKKESHYVNKETGKEQEYFWSDREQLTYVPTQYVDILLRFERPVTRVVYYPKNVVKVPSPEEIF